MIPSVCPCDGGSGVAPTNLPGLTRIAYRVGDYVSVRQAVLTPLPGEQCLSADGVPIWRTQGAGDLAVMVAEWFAVIADIITFYNERIVNQAYLRTADLPESVTDLIALLGYRPRPAIGAVGSLAALLSPGAGVQPIILPRGLAFQSKPTPGQAPQIFELSADTAIVGPDQYAAAPPPTLLTAASGGAALLLDGAVTTLDPGTVLRLRARSAATGGPWRATIVSTTVGPAPSGIGRQTSVVVSLSGTPPACLAAAQASLEAPRQTASVWALFGGAISGDGLTVHLAGLVRQIRAGDWVLFTGSGQAPVLALVAATAETIWDATGTTAHPNQPANPRQPVPIPHTVLSLGGGGISGWAGISGVAVGFDWVPVGTLIDQPFGIWNGSNPALLGTGPAAFPSWSSQPIFLRDAHGAGLLTTAGSDASSRLSLAAAPTPAPALQPPFQVLPNLLPVSRGKTVAGEILGSGDATNPAQDFKLSQSPVTYLSQGAGYVSTIALRVAGQPWTEVASFYGQAPTATVFVTREDAAGQTHVMFGDGVNGARLPTGTNNVVATYRVGGGAATPPPGKVTVIATSWPGLRGVLDPVGMSGGADPDPPDQIRRTAPRSVLTFGRAVSVFDYQALAAQVPGVARAGAIWAWNESRQRSLVTVYVGDDAAAATAARRALAAIGDPNRPVVVAQATAIAVTLTMTLLVTPGMDPTAIARAVVTALTDAETGLFTTSNLGIGQVLFDSQIEATVLAVPGAVAIKIQTFAAAGVIQSGPLHSPGEGQFYTLDPTTLHLTTEADSHGG